MDIYQKLTVLTCVTSVITLILVVVAIIPHFKEGLQIIRDAVLWITFALVIFAAGWVAWQRISQRWEDTARDGRPPAIQSAHRPDFQTVAAWSSGRLES